MDTDEKQPIDKAEAKAKLQNELAFVHAWIKHPITSGLLESWSGEEKVFVDRILNRKVTDVASLVAHFEFLGYLRCLRDQRNKVNEHEQVLSDALKKL